MSNVTITGSGHNSTITLYKIHQGDGSFRNDTSTTHSQVKPMQEALTELGFDTHGADGKFGKNTEEAVRDFQSDRGLTSDGYFGRRSLEALEVLIGGHLDPDNCGGDGPSTDGSSTLHKGDSGAEVTTLQNRLTELLYYCGTPDGEFGENTYLAVKYFQERNELPVDGIVGTDTWNVLNSSSAVKGVDNDIINWSAKEEPITLYQNRSFWRSYPYDAEHTSTVETIGAAGCGPSAMAIVVSTLLGKAVTPPILGNWALDHGYRDHNGVSGTSASFFQACANEFDLVYGGSYTDRNAATFNTVKNWCNNGGLAIINVKADSPYTKGGHYNVCYKVENDKIYIKDPNYANRDLPAYSISDWTNSSEKWFGSIRLIKR